MVAGDNLLGFDLAPVHQAFRATGAPTLVVRRITPGPGPSPYNEVTLDDDGRVTRFREKPNDPQTDLVAVALYFFPPSLVDDLSTYLHSGGISDAPGHFIAWLVQQRSVSALPLAGEWFDIGSLEALEKGKGARFGSALFKRACAQALDVLDGKTAVTSEKHISMNPGAPTGSESAGAARSPKEKP